MQSHQQLLEDERIAIALSQLEAEEYDSFVPDVHEEHRDLPSFPSDSVVFGGFLDHCPELDFLNEIEERRIRMEQRPKIKLRHFSEPEGFEYIDDDVPGYVLQALFEDVENSRPRNRIEEEVKRERPVVLNRDVRNQSLNRGSRHPNRHGRGKRGVVRRPEILDAPSNYVFDEDNASYEELMKLDEDNFDKGKGFSEQQLKKLRIEPYRNPNPKNKESCSICMSELNTKDFIIKLNCSHIFHKDCIKEWLARKKTCAICKVEVKL